MPGIYSRVLLGKSVILSNLTSYSGAVQLALFHWVQVLGLLRNVLYGVVSLGPPGVCENVS